MQLRVLTFLLVNVCTDFASCLYFHIGRNEKRCFVKETGDEVTVIGKLETRRPGLHGDRHVPPNQDFVTLEITEPDGRLVLSKSYASQGTFMLKSQKPGKHHICLQANRAQRPLSAAATVTVHLELWAARENLTALQLRVVELMEQVEHIRRQHHELRLREKEFRDVDLSTNMWMYWWPVVRSLYIVTFIMLTASTWSRSASSSSSSSAEDRKWSPGESRDGQQSQKEPQGVEGEQDGAEDELQPQDEGLQ